MNAIEDDDKWLMQNEAALNGVVKFSSASLLIYSDT